MLRIARGGARSVDARHRHAPVEPLVQRLAPLGSWVPRGPVATPVAGDMCQAPVIGLCTGESPDLHRVPPHTSCRFPLPRGPIPQQDIMPATAFPL